MSFNFIICFKEAETTVICSLPQVFIILKCLIYSTVHCFLTIHLALWCTLAQGNPDLCLLNLLWTWLIIMIWIRKIDQASKIWQTNIFVYPKAVLRIRNPDPDPHGSKLKGLPNPDPHGQMRIRIQIQEVKMPRKCTGSLSEFRTGRSKVRILL